MTDNKINTRRMKLEDLPQVMQIEHSRDDLPWPEDIFQKCIEVGYECWVIEKEKRLIAYAILAFIGKDAHIFNICVLPDEQGKGYGKHLIRRFLILSKKQKAQAVLLKVRETKKNAYALYRKFGFKQIELLPDYYDVPSGKENALVLRLAI